MKSYMYPKLLRSELDPRYVSSPAARSEAVNTALVETDIDTLTRAGLRRARQHPKLPYEPFGVALGDAALRVMNSLPSSTSRSALIQWILSANRLPLNLVKPSSAGLATVDMATQQPAGKQKALKTAALPVISIGSFAAITDAVWAEDGGLDIALHIPPGIAERLLMQTIANRGRRWG